MDSIKTIIMGVAIFSIISEILKSLISNESYKRYYAQVSGLLLMIIVLKPILGIMNENVRFDELFIHEDNVIYSAYGKIDMINEACSDKIMADLNAGFNGYGLTVENVDLILDSNENSETYGKIIRITVNAKRNKSSDGITKDSITQFIMKQYNLKERQVDVKVAG